MSDELIQPDDQALLDLLASLERGGEGAETPFLPPAAGSESAETLARLYTEVLGLLPYEHAPSAPPVAIRRRLMAIVRGEDLGDDLGHLRELGHFETADLEILPEALPEIRPETRRHSAPAPLPSAERRPRPVAAPTSRPAVGPATAAPSTQPLPVRPVPSRPASRWPLALAASLALVAGGLAGYLFVQNNTLEGQVAALQNQRNQVIAEVKTTSAKLRAANSALEDHQRAMTEARVRMSLMSSPGVEISSLKPTGKVALPETASGMLFVAADHQHWHLSVRGLNPAEKGHHYQLWFIAPGGAVSGGVFAGGPGDPVHLSSEHMPPGTQAVVITLEPEVGGKAPTGPEYLRAAPPVKIL